MRHQTPLFFAALATTSANALADPPRRDSGDATEGSTPPDETSRPRPASLLRSTEGAPKVAKIWLSLVGWTGAVGSVRERGAGALLSIPFDGLASRRVSASDVAGSSAGPDEAANAIAEELRLRPDETRSLVRAALRAAHLLPEEEHLAELAARAKSSAALPELRLRVLRSVNTSLRLTPTEVDPYAQVAGDGVGTIYEARATWRLDRLVFADDEVAIERVRVERNEQRLKLTMHVIETLSAWETAYLRAIDATLSTAERADALRHAIVAHTALDALTDGQFSKMRDEATTK